MFSAGCSLCRAERVYPVKSAKMGKPPPAEPREARRAARPKAGDAFRGGGKPSAPITQNLPGKHSTPPKIFPRNASCPPRGRGTNDFRLSSLVAPAPSRLPELSVPDSRGGRFSEISLFAPRAPRLWKLPSPDPRGRCPSDFCCPIPACRVQSFFASRLRARFPGEPRSPAPASRW